MPFLYIFLTYLTMTCFLFKSALLQSSTCSDISIYVCTLIFHMTESENWRQKKLVLLISRRRRQSVRTSPLMCCSWLGWHPGLFPLSLAQTKACPADWAEGLRGLILVFSTWLPPSEACVLLCLMWAFSLQRKQLFGRTLRTTTFSSFYLETSA